MGNDRAWRLELALFMIPRGELHCVDLLVISLCS